MLDKGKLEKTMKTAQTLCGLTLVVRAFLSAALVVVLVSGCASYQTVDAQTPERAVNRLAVGDEVRIETRDGQTARFAIAAVEDNVITGDGKRIPVSEIASVSVKQRSDFDWNETGIVVSSLIGLGLFFSLL
jgi:hypothetical protein